MNLAQLIAVPVVVVTTSDIKSGQTLAMISTVSYVQLQPLTLSTGFSVASRTGKAISDTGKFAVSIMTFDQLKKIEQFSQINSEQAGDKLELAGFEKKKFEKSHLEYVSGCLAAFSLNVVGKFELENYTAVFGLVTEEAYQGDPIAKDLDPLIRYNRCYAPIDKSRLKRGVDSYPI